MQDRSLKTLKKAGGGAVLGGVVGAATGYCLSTDACPAGLSAMYANLSAYPPAVKSQVETAAAAYTRDIIQRYWPYKMIQHNMWGYEIPPPEGLYNMIQASCTYVSKVAFDSAVDAVKLPLLACAPLLNPGTIIPQLCAMGTIIGFSAALLSNYMYSSSDAIDEPAAEVTSSVMAASDESAEASEPAESADNDIAPQEQPVQRASSNPNTLFANKGEMLTAIKDQTHAMRKEMHGFRESIKNASMNESSAEESVGSLRISK